MTAEIVELNEIIDASIDEELLLDYEEDGEFHFIISATAAFMKRDLKRIVGFCEAVVPSYQIALSIDLNHLKSWQVQVQSPQEIVLAENQFNYRSRFWHLTSSLHLMN